jgi:FtsH-binding integral membrane protein
LPPTGEYSARLQPKEEGVLKRIVLVGWLVLLASLVIVPMAFAQTDGGDGEGDVVTDAAMYALLVGFLLPPVLSIVIQTSWSEKLKAAVAFAACLVAGAGTAYFAEDLTLRSFASAALIVLTTGMATYRNFWRPTGISPTIEEKTNLGDGGGGE